MDTSSTSSKAISPSSNSPAPPQREPLAAYAAYLLILDTVSSPAHNNALNEKRSQASAPAASLKSENLGLGWHTINEIYYVVFNGKRFRVRETKRYFTIAGVVVDASIDKKYTPVSSSVSSSRDLLQNKVLEKKDLSPPVENIHFSNILALLSTFTNQI